MKVAIEILKNKKEQIVECLKQNINREENVTQIAVLNKAIHWLTKLEELGMNEVNKYEIVKLPDMNTGYSNFRIMNDCETDHREDWIEFTQHMALIEGDFIISSKTI